ncbi:MAG: DUF1573 domain-containing protein [Bacteroidota bacterium]
MKKIALASLLFFSLLAIAWMPKNAELSAKIENAKVVKASFNLSADGSINWSTTEHDFGSIKQGVPVSYDFEIQNTGDQAVKILDVKTSCGCTAAGYSKEPLDPGSSTFLTANYNAKSAGVFKKEIKVYTDFQEEPFKLTIKGEVELAE